MVTFWTYAGESGTTLISGYLTLLDGNQTNICVFLVYRKRRPMHNETIFPTISRFSHAFSVLVAARYIEP